MPELEPVLPAAEALPETDIEIPAIEDLAGALPDPVTPAEIPAPAPPGPRQAAEAAPAPPAGGPAPGEASAQLPPAQLPPDIELRYAVTGQAKGFNYHARSSMSLRHDNRRYEASASVSAFLLGRREQRSEGRIDAQGMHPEVFVDQSRRERRAVLDAAGQRIRFHHGVEAPLQAGTQDRLSVALQLSALFLARPDAYPAGSAIRLPVTDVTDVELWDFVVEGPDTLDLDSGGLPTIRLARQPRRERDRKVEIWLAPAMSYLPARIRISEANGDYVDQTIEAPLPATQRPLQ